MGTKQIKTTEKPSFSKIRTLYVSAPLKIIVESFRRPKSSNRIYPSETANKLASNHLPELVLEIISNLITKSTIRNNVSLLETVISPFRASFSSVAKFFPITRMHAILNSSHRDLSEIIFVNKLKTTFFYTEAFDEVPDLSFESQVSKEEPKQAVFPQLQKTLRTSSLRKSSKKKIIGSTVSMQFVKIERKDTEEKPNKRKISKTLRSERSIKKKLSTLSRKTQKTFKQQNTKKSKVSSIESLDEPTLFVGTGEFKTKKNVHKIKIDVREIWKEKFIDTEMTRSISLLLNRTTKR